jgi:hypothetical protein
MNCSNHTEVSAVAYCRTCGKALCANCTREVRGVVYCENCIAARLEGVMPPSSVLATTAAAHREPRAAGAGPNPALAGILAGFFPFGVGAVYVGQYAKGLAHLVVFTLLVVGESSVNNGALHTMFGLGIAAFYFYQIIDAVRSARAMQAGEPAPDPFGLGSTFAMGGDGSEISRVPVGALVLIGLGVLFLLHTAGLLAFDVLRIISIFLIVLGVWLFVRRRGFLGHASTECSCARCRTRCLMGPAVLVTVGLLLLLHSFDLPKADFGHTWPVILLVIGVVKLLQSNASTEGHIGRSLGGLPPSAGSSPSGAPSGEMGPPSSEVKNV